MGSPGSHPSTVTPNIICDLGISSICIRGSTFGSFESNRSTRPSSGFSERAAGKRTVMVWAETVRTHVRPAPISKSVETRQRILKYTNAPLWPAGARLFVRSAWPHYGIEQEYNRTRLERRPCIQDFAFVLRRQSYSHCHLPRNG